MSMVEVIKGKNPGSGREFMFVFKSVDARPYVEVYVGGVVTRTFDWAFIKSIMMVSVLYHPVQSRVLGLAQLGDVDWRDLGISWISWALPDIANEFASRTQIKICFH